MPRVNTLLDLCVSAVVRHAQYFANESSADPAYRFVTSPFAAVELHLVSAILTRLAEQKNFALPIVGPLLRPDLLDVIIPASATQLLTNSFFVLLGVRCKRLRKLSIPQCKTISGAAFSQLVSQLAPNQLVHVDVSSCSKLTDSSIADLIKFHSQSLKRLVLSGLPIGPASLPLITTCNLLEQLDLSGSNSLDDASLLTIIQGCSSLEKLSINDCWHVSSSSLSAISVLTKLTTLDASLTGMDDDSLRSIVQSCTRLTSLNLAACSQLRKDAPFLIGRYVGTRLVSLRLDAFQRTDHLYDLKACPNLEQLALCHCHAQTHDLVDIFSSHTRLQNLDLSGIPELSNPALVALADSPSAASLTRLSVMDIGTIDDLGIEVLVEKAPLLQELNVRNCPQIGNSFMFKLAATGPTRLVSLDIGNNASVSADAVTAVLQGVPSLVTLDISGCERITRRDYDGLMRAKFSANIKWQ